MFEYGCGTGPAAYALAARDFQADAVDFIREAIGIARQMAEQLGEKVAFSVADVCALSSEAPTTRYDLVVDGFCL